MTELARLILVVSLNPQRFARAVFYCPKCKFHSKLIPKDASILFTEICIMGNRSHTLDFVLVWILFSQLIVTGQGLVYPTKPSLNRRYPRAKGVEVGLLGPPAALSVFPRAQSVEAVGMWGGIFVGLDDLRAKCNSAEKRREFLEGLVVDGLKVSWRECELAFAFSLKDDDRDWCFGLFDTTLAKLLKGEYDVMAGGEDADTKARAFAQELTDALSINATEFDDVATSLMILRIREAVEDQAYDAGVELGEFQFGDESLKISPAADRLRREALFKALCALRFVRLGLQL